MKFAATVASEQRKESMPCQSPADIPMLRLRHLWLCLPALLTFVFVSTQSQYEVDLWPHLNLGRFISETGSLPRQAFYSYRSEGEAVVDQCWLSQAILFQIHDVCGREGLRFVVSFLYACGIACVTWLSFRRCQSVHATTTAMAVCLLLSVSNLSARPQLFSFLSFQVAMVVLLHWQEGKTWPFVIYILNQVFWSNTHGAFPLGVILPGIFLFGQLPAVVMTGGMAGILTHRPTQRLLLLTLLSFIACFINPDPQQTIGYLTGVIGRSQQRGITEWQATSLTDFTGAVFFGSVLLAVIVCFLARKKPSLTDIVLLLAFCVLGLRATRMVIWWGSLLPVILAPAAASVCWRSGAKNTWEEEPENRLFNRGMALILTALFCVSTPWTRQYNPLLPANRKQNVAAEEPRDAIQFLTSRQFCGRLFSRMEWGGYAAFMLPRPELIGSPAVHSVRAQIHMDAMIDFFPDGVWSDYCTVMGGEEDWNRILQRDQVQAVLVPSTEPPRIVQHLQASPDWEQAYRDEVAQVFMRRQTTAAAITLPANASAMSF